MSNVTSMQAFVKFRNERAGADRLAQLVVLTSDPALKVRQAELHDQRVAQRAEWNITYLRKNPTATTLPYPDQLEHSLLIVQGLYLKAIDAAQSFPVSAEIVQARETDITELLRVALFMVLEAGKA